MPSSCVGSSSLKISDTPSLINSPSSISISLRRRMTNNASMLYFHRGRGRPSKAISHISGVPWPRFPRHSPSPPSPDIRLPSGLGRRASIISELDMACTTSLVSPSFPRMSEIRARTLNSPAFFHSPTESAHVPAPPPPQRVIVSTPQAFELHSPRLARQQARQSAPIPLSLVLAHVPRSRLPVLARVSKRFSAAAQQALYRTRELSADDAGACVTASWRTTSRGAPLGSGALSALTLIAFDAELLATAPGTLSHLALLTDTLLYAFFDDFLAALTSTHLSHLALSHFVGVPHAAHDVPPAAAPRLAVLGSSHGLAVALAPSRPLRRVTLRIASMLYDRLRPAALFGALGGSLKELVLALGVDVHARVVIRHAGEYERGAGCTRVVSRGYFRRGLAPCAVSWIPIAERAGASYAPPAGISADRGWNSGPSRPALWTRPPLWSESALRRVSFWRSVGTGAGESTHELSSFITT
ncbi:hypothetical protein EDB89DRAFT_2233663 [Lactarius sanguifluus]|nr:hypothetical protein EDB89DRAFT_2233663 [Lactarius sanguifluus]